MADPMEELYSKLKKDAEQSGYHLNPDGEFVRQLLAGLVANRERYGYLACPCRLASGVKKEDLDIICPCDYRDEDLNEFQMCYCGLYVSGELIRNGGDIQPIPDRRPPEGRPAARAVRSSPGELPLPVYRCTVCGYLCARDNPPEVCPICRAGKERFERFL